MDGHKIQEKIFELDNKIGNAIDKLKKFSQKHKLYGKMTWKLENYKED
jgi:hypothetical protein